MSEIDDVKASPEYQKYHQLVVTECVRITGEHNREFFDKICDYIDDFKEGTPPEEVARHQWEAWT